MSEWVSSTCILKLQAGLMVWLVDTRAGQTLSSSWGQNQGRRLEVARWQSFTVLRNCRIRAVSLSKWYIYLQQAWFWIRSVNRSFYAVWTPIYRPVKDFIDHIEAFLDSMAFSLLLRIDYRIVYNPLFTQLPQVNGPPVSLPPYLEQQLVCGLSQNYGIGSYL